DDSFGPSISADGRFVAFNSYATNFAADDTNGTLDAFVHDRAGRTVRVSVDNAGAQLAGGGSLSVVGGSAISGDGHLVTFFASTTGGRIEVYVRDHIART